MQRLDRLGLWKVSWRFPRPVPAGRPAGSTSSFWATSCPSLSPSETRSMFYHLLSLIKLYQIQNPVCKLISIVSSFHRGQFKKIISNQVMRTTSCVFIPFRWTQTLIICFTFFFHFHVNTLAHQSLNRDVREKFSSGFRIGP